MVLTELSPVFMNNSYKNKKINNFKSQKFDWEIIQSEMKNKFGLDIYESWLKKINFEEEFNNYVLCLSTDLFVIGLHQDT